MRALLAALRGAARGPPAPRFPCVPVVVLRQSVASRRGRAARASLVLSLSGDGELCVLCARVLCTTRAGRARARDDLWVQCTIWACARCSDLPLGRWRIGTRGGLSGGVRGLSHGRVGGVDPRGPRSRPSSRQTAFAVGGAFRSGADSAFLFDTLQAAGRNRPYPPRRAGRRGDRDRRPARTAIVGGFSWRRSICGFPTSRPSRPAGAQRDVRAPRSPSRRCITRRATSVRPSRAGGGDARPQARPRPLGDEPFRVRDRHCTSTTICSSRTCARSGAARGLRRGVRGDEGRDRAGGEQGAPCGTTPSVRVAPPR